ncbi:type I-E CRISPR-associated protein Cas6/Cse3/CasE [Streptomyces sp. NPDC088785]|uniref:type I-E CRISPR-associated protein Cas6/Cse3/CasE n=1 Tax=Streptomyces sp. NPDC088785 TaxID=3365897 RepID=UPI00381140C2
MNVHPDIARIRLNPHSRDVQRDLRDATQMHRTVMRLVPDDLGDAPRQKTGMLYRLEESDTSSTLLVQAASLDPARLPRGYGNAEVKSLAPMFTALRKGLGVRYRIDVNPCKRERLPLQQKGQRGRVIPLAGPDADQWWTRRAAEAGLDLHVLTPTSLEPVRSRGPNASQMRHTLLRYDGTATVTDPDALCEAVTNGIGRGKPYGAGLLTLAPARTA